MTNKVETVVAAITTKLKAAGISTVYRWPEELSKVGNRYPLALIKEESQDFVMASGQQYEYILTITITLASDQIRERMKYMNALENACFAQLFADCTLGGIVSNCNPVRVSMGDLLSGSNLSGYAGFNETTTFRTITLTCLVFDARP